MFDSNQRSTGTEYTRTVALLAMALVFVPAVLVASNSYGYVAISVAAACSVLCSGLAWLSWKRSSQLSIPSITTPRPDVK